MLFVMLRFFKVDFRYKVKSEENREVEFEQSHSGLEKDLGLKVFQSEVLLQSGL